MPAVRFDRIQSVLCLGAHSDDIEIGCGGAILQLIQKHPDVSIHWVVLSGAGVREREARASAELFLAGCKSAEIVVHPFRDAYFPIQWEELKNAFSALAKQCDPDLIFTHRLEDRHQDHRVVSELTWNHFRRHMILEYEIPKYEGDLSTPSFYIPLNDEMAATKIDILMKSFNSQQTKPWFDRTTFEGIMRIRGLESGGDGSFAEGFHSRKLAVQF